MMFEYTDLTPKQKEVLHQLLLFTEENSYPPSIQQLCQLCGVRSTSTIHFHLSALKKKKMINWNPSEKRAISIRDDLKVAYRSQKTDETFPQHNFTETSAEDMPLEEAGSLPLLGSIAAGAPLQTVKDSTDMLDLKSDICPPGCYALIVRGESMIEDHIMDGDVVIINAKAPVREGDAVVALIEGETTTLKHYFKEKNRIRLEPANASMQPIYATDVQIQGKVEAIIRKYR